MTKKAAKSGLDESLSKKITLFIFLLCLPALFFAQEKFTINGYVKDANAGETLIGATVFVKELGTGTTTNEYGFYSITG